MTISEELKTKGHLTRALYRAALYGLRYNTRTRARHVAAILPQLVVSVLYLTRRGQNIAPNFFGLRCCCDYLCDCRCDCLCECRCVCHCECRYGSLIVANLQALVSYERKFLWWSSKCCGSTHDSLAWDTSNLGMHMKEHGLPGDFWIAGDEAYVNSESLLGPYPSHSGMNAVKDTWNYYQSRCRINVECAFGQLVKRWGILRRPLATRLTHTNVALSECMKLHNLCVHDHFEWAPRPLSINVADGDTMRPISQHHVTHAPRYQEKKGRT